MAGGILKIIGQVKSWCNISSCRGQINPNEKRPHHSTCCSLNGSQMPPRLLHQHAKHEVRSKKSLLGLHHWKVEDMQVPLHSFIQTSPLLIAQRKGQLSEDMWDPKERHRDMQCHCSVIRRLILFDQRPHHNVHKALACSFAIGLRRDSQNCSAYWRRSLSPCCDSL